MLLIFDENYSPHLAEGLNILEQANSTSPYQVEVVHVTKLVGKKGASDEEVIELAGKNTGVILTQDTDFKKLKHYKNLYKQHNTGVIFFHSTSKKFLFWNQVESFIKNWERIKEVAHTSSSPFVYKFGLHGGVEHLPF